MPRRRTLRPEEAELWQAVARMAKPMPGRSPPVDPALVPIADLPPALAPSPVAAPRVQPFRLGERSKALPGHDLVPPLSDRLAAAPLRMDAKAFGRMSRGRIAPEARIDLHGMTIAEAHPELIRFVLNAQSQGMRLILVITGKGRPGSDDGPIPRRPGVLRHQVPLWLARVPLAPAVLQVAEAHQRHGGAGALYVYLRRG
ncbi:MAG: Smr/MutS family protein [Gemmobacter sp.]